MRRDYVASALPQCGVGEVARLRVIVVGVDHDLAGNGSCGRVRSAGTRIATATTWPKRAASATVPARALPPIEATTPATVCGPQELLIMTSSRTAAKRTASACPATRRR
jgi:hypothetical protein